MPLGRRHMPTPSRPVRPWQRTRPRASAHTKTSITRHYVCMSRPRRQGFGLFSPPFAGERALFSTPASATGNARAKSLQKATLSCYRITMALMALRPYIDAQAGALRARPPHRSRERKSTPCRAHFIPRLLLEMPRYFRLAGATYIRRRAEASMLMMIPCASRRFALYARQGAPPRF